MATLRMWNNTGADISGNWQNSSTNEIQDPVSGDTLNSNGRTILASGFIGTAGTSFTLINTTYTGSEGFIINNNYGEIKIGAGGIYGLPEAAGSHPIPDPGDNRGNIIVQSGGKLKLYNSNYGNISVESGGVFTYETGYSWNNYGLISVEGGFCTNNAVGGNFGGGVIIVKKGTFTFSMCINFGCIIVESSGTADLDGILSDTGIIVYKYANITNTDSVVSIVAVPYERRTLQYTSGATDTYPDKITVDTQLLYGKPGDYMDDCIERNLLPGKTIAEVTGSGGYYAY